MQSFGQQLYVTGAPPSTAASTTCYELMCMLASFSAQLYRTCKGNYGTHRSNGESKWDYLLSKGPLRVTMNASFYIAVM